jgi:N6-L-threonylcarbamoyladenine synthase
VIILALETSCDETAVSVVKNGNEVLSNVISSQIEFHKKYGGIVPEVAARKHIEVISPIIKEALEQAKVTFKDIDAVAVTYGPGLVGSLLVGICAAKAIAWAIDKPLIGVNHLEGHIYANFLSSPPLIPLSIKDGEGETPTKVGEGVRFPFVCLLVSGGHTMLVLVEGHGKYKTLGRTRDDAAGEAFDKIARFLNLGYPGGPIIDQLAKEGNPKAIGFKRPMIEEKFGYDFSFSGLKTAVVNFVRRLPAGQAGQSPIVPHMADIAASFQQTIVDVLVEKSIRAAKEFQCKEIALAGGVSANSLLRNQFSQRGREEGLSIYLPPFEYCTDNAAMIACAAYHRFVHLPLPAGRQASSLASRFNLSPVASLRLT